MRRLPLRAPHEQRHEPRQARTDNFSSPVLEPMYVCLCNAITDGEIRGAIALGARSVADLKSTLGVATCCGRCEDCASQLLKAGSEQTVVAGDGD
jgi:bacterioferritin-associated ferredoxin